MTFWYHYNKPASLKSKKPKLTLHFSKACHIVESIVCDVKTFTHLRKDQPRIVVKGHANKIEIKNNTAYIF